MVAQANPGSRGFINHAYMAFTSDPEKLAGKYTPNKIESIGDVLSWHVTKLPGHVRDALKDPKVVTVALTALALLAVQFVFYSAATIIATKAVLTFAAKYMTASIVKITAYTTIQTAILGIGVRALGRFGNTDLMTQWYAKVPQDAVV